MTDPPFEPGTHRPADRLTFSCSPRALILLCLPRAHCQAAPTPTGAATCAVGARRSACSFAAAAGRNATIVRHRPHGTALEDARAPLLCVRRAAGLTLTLTLTRPSRLYRQVLRE